MEEGGEKISAIATIVVYADGDGDGVLDGRSAGSPSPDRVLATSAPEMWRGYSDTEPTQHEITYFTEAYSYGENGPDFPAGFSIMRFALGEGLSGVVPIETPIELRVTGAPYLQDLVCDSVCHESSVTFECPADPNELPEPPSGAVSFRAGNTTHTGYGWSEGGDDNHITLHSFCAAGNYSWTRVTCEGCACLTEGCFYAKEDVAEEDWPCAD